MRSLPTLLMILVLIPFSAAAFTEKSYTRPDDATIKKNLSSMQYYVTQEKGTEPPFDNAYWDKDEPGIYVDIITGEPLFSSLDKFESGTGWPSFTKPITPNVVVLQEDNGLFTKRVEVISKYGRSHLGHVFDDGPEPTYKRYCMNSAALLFIPVNELKMKGYGEYLILFGNDSKPHSKNKTP